MRHRELGIAVASSLLLILPLINLPLLGETDLELVRAVQSHRSFPLDLLFLSIYFSFYPILPLYLYRRRSYIVPQIVPLLLFLAVTYLMVRPLNIFSERAPRFAGAGDVISNYVPFHFLWRETWCFPSEHLVITSFMAFLSRRMFFYLILTWISTVYIGDHYPSDIIVNSLIGFLLSQLTLQIQKKLYPAGFRSG